MTDSIRLDATALRVLAHPLRSRLLSELRLHGPATATDLADRLKTNTGATSYHLRRLAEVGLVADTGEGAGRRRVWQPTSREHEWSPGELAGDEASEESMTWLHRHYLTEMAARAEAWFQHERGWSRPWRDALGYGDDGVLVTPAQARAMGEEIRAVLARYRDAGAGDPDAIPLLVATVTVPVDPRPERDAP